jgi:hypothetical protein
MNYPVELAVGNEKMKKGMLPDFFNARGWDFTWDFDRTGYWFEVRYDKIIIMQVEEDVQADDLVKTIKKDVPDFDETVLNISELEKIVKYADGHYLYVWPTGNVPRWEGAR